MFENIKSRDDDPQQMIGIHLARSRSGHIKDLPENKRVIFREKLKLKFLAS